MEFDDDMILGEAIDLLLEGAINGGVICPCCSQFAKVYKRKINTAMARGLTELYKEGRASKFVHAPTVSSCREVSQLSWWGLVVEESTLRPDGGRSGYWRVTKKGEQFIKNEVKCEKYTYVFDSKILGHDGDMVDISEALGEPFHYRELMNEPIKT
jgi:hypothetical protein